MLPGRAAGGLGQSPTPGFGELARGVLDLKWRFLHLEGFELVGVWGFFSFQVCLRRNRLMSLVPGGASCKEHLAYKRPFSCFCSFLVRGG